MAGCETFWSGGHWCQGETAGHPREHTCASRNCPSPLLSADCWGRDAGPARHGDQREGRAYRQLYFNGPRDRRP